MSTIKDAARQAWLDQQTQDSEGGVPDSVSFIYGFIAGYEHLQSAFDDRVRVIEIQIEDKKKLQEENQRLRREVEVLRQYGNKDCTAMADEVLDNE